MDRIRIYCVLLVLPALLQSGCWHRTDDVATAPEKPSDEEVSASSELARYPQESLQIAQLSARRLPPLDEEPRSTKQSPAKQIHLDIGKRSLPVFRLPDLEEGKRTPARVQLQIEVGAPISDLTRLPNMDDKNVEALAGSSDGFEELQQPIGDVVAHEVQPLPPVDEQISGNRADNGNSAWSEFDKLLERDWPAVAAAPPIVSNPPRQEPMRRLPNVGDDSKFVEDPRPVEAVTTLEQIQLPEQPIAAPQRQPTPAVHEPAVADEPRLEARPLVDPMHAVNAQAIREIRHAFSLAQRGAMFSARVELTQALRTITEALDLRDGSRKHTDALKRGFRALDEAKDFRQRGLAEELDIEVLVAAHRTPVLKESDASRITPLVAVQKYLTYAQEQLVIAGDDQPTASLALYGLGRLQADLAVEQEDTLPHALVFHQAAVLVDEMNYKAANELGVLLANYGQYAQARNMLAHSVHVCPQPESWNNLAKVHQQLGETDLARRAANESQLAAGGNRNQGAVRWVDPATLAGTIETSQPVRRVTQPTQPETQSPTRNASQDESDGLMRLIPWMRRGG